jgi:two-component system chemotaxis response regulator CheY
MTARILVVDDEPIFRRLLVNSLMDRGYAVAGASHGGEALAELRRQVCDIVLLDLVMPVVDGFSFLRQRAADPELSNVPVVVLSASGVEPLKQAAQLDAAAVLQKPPDLDELEDVISRIVRVSSMRAPAGVPIGTCPICGVLQRSQLDGERRAALDRARVEHVLSHTASELARLPIRSRILGLSTVYRRRLANWLYDDLRHNWGDLDRIAAHSVDEALGSTAMHALWQSAVSCGAPGCRHLS